MNGDPALLGGPKLSRRPQIHFWRDKDKEAQTSSAALVDEVDQFHKEVKRDLERLRA